METLDLRSMPPRVRHETIFAKLDALGGGDTLRIVNDHDPVPLRYQLDATRPHEYAWESVEGGPEQWMIDITRHARIVDARPLIAAGGEPFEEIMQAAAALGDREVLVVYAPFDPVPLEGVLGEQGFQFYAAALEGGDWKVTFFRS